MLEARSLKNLALLEPQQLLVPIEKLRTRFFAADVIQEAKMETITDWMDDKPAGRQKIWVRILHK